MKYFCMVFEDVRINPTDADIDVKCPRGVLPKFAMELIEEDIKELEVKQISREKRKIKDA